MQLDRSGVRRQFPALGQRSSLTSAAGGSAWPTRCLTSFLEETTNLLNGLLSQVPTALWRLVLGLIVPAHGCLPFWVSRSIELADRLQHGGSQPSDNWPVATALGRGRADKVWLALPWGRSKHDGAEGGQAPRPERRAASPQLWQRPHLRRGRLRHPALPIQPCPVLLSPRRVGPGTEDSPGPPRAGVAAGADHGRRSSCGLSAISSTSCWSLAGCTARPAWS
jgi:hypothetical protein